MRGKLIRQIFTVGNGLDRSEKISILQKSFKNDKTPEFLDGDGRGTFEY